MNSWRDTILRDFVPNAGRLTLVIDPDCLVTEEKMVLELRRRGFEILEFNDPIEFRYVYESMYRSVWDKGGHTDLLVILRTVCTDPQTLPYDLLQAGRRLSFSLGDIFPNFNYQVIENLDRRLLDELYAAQLRYKPQGMGKNASMDFILANVFHIQAGQIYTDQELLRLLLQMHYGRRCLPDLLARRLLQVLAQRGCFRDWPLAELIASETAFYAFLQERWPIFLMQHKHTGQISEDSQSWGLKYPGPAYLPLDDEEIWVYVDSLFLEGKLKPVKADGIELEANSRLRCGVLADRENSEERISQLFELVDNKWPEPDSSCFNWLDYALKHARAAYEVYGSANSEHLARLADIDDKMNQAFASWLFGHYQGLRSMSPSTPVMLQHVPRLLARELENSRSQKVALVVLDGLALEQWLVIASRLLQQESSLVFQENALFAWIPTLTSVSRQALFSGKEPIYFANSINTTANEEKLWRRFWEEQGLALNEIAYRKGIDTGEAKNILEQIVHPQKTRAAGFVLDKIDKIMHGMQLGAPGMRGQIDLWAANGFLKDFILGLLDLNFAVWLTSDHGNIECKGIGRPAEGSIASTRGERVRVYQSEELREQVAREFPSAIKWQPTGLPANYLPLIAAGNDAFINKNEIAVSHGGISLQEVIVPLLKVERAR